MMQKKLSLAVVDFALPVPRKGSIEMHSGFLRGSSDSGRELHLEVQANRKKMFPLYQAELPIAHTFEHGDYLFEVKGRMDGFYNDEPAKIEEIKSGFTIYDLYNRLKSEADDHPYCLQLKTYGYIHWLKTKEKPQLNLHLISSRNGETIDFNLKLHIKKYEQWLALRLEELVYEAKLAEKMLHRRLKAGRGLTFPFKIPRPGQMELMASISGGMNDNKPMLIQAPTGLGKTIGVMFPLLEDALCQGQKVIYATPKNSQHLVAEDAVKRLRAEGADIRSLTMTAKKKMCFKDEPICNPEYCEYAKDHYTKVAANKLADVLLESNQLTSDIFQKVALKHEVCPFELQFEAIKEVDIVICDYNYVFAPRFSLNTIMASLFTEDTKPNLIIDEVHNLPQRGMDYYSPTLSAVVLEKMLSQIDALPEHYQKKTEVYILSCIAIIKACAEMDTANNVLTLTHEFLRQDEKLHQFLSTYLNSDAEIKAGDVILKLSNYWSEFTSALEYVSAHQQYFFTTTHLSPPTINIVCCDASSLLKSTYEDYQHVVGFSATLKPFHFYSQLIGLKEDVMTAEFTSSFPKERRKVLIIPQISTKFSERPRNYPRIALTIDKIASLKQGNYFVFFPSFDFLEKVLDIFIPPEGFDILCQKRHMKKDDIQFIFDRLRDAHKSYLIFAVQGGVFSEGVDYPGDMIIGAFIVGPPLPQFDVNREKMREYYEKNYASGFDFAYVYPAMAKTVQAAGRVIRSEKDKGIIVLLDNRFLHASYTQCMPQDWFENQASEIVSNSILQEVKDFWAEER